MSQTAVTKGADVEKDAGAKHAADAPKTAAETSKIASGTDQSTKSVEKPDEVITAVLDSWMVGAVSTFDDFALSVRLCIFSMMRQILIICVFKSCKNKLKNTSHIFVYR